MKSKIKTFKDIDRELELLKIQNQLKLSEVNVSLENIKTDIAPKKLSKSILNSLAMDFRKTRGLQMLVLTLLVNFALSKTIFKKYPFLKKYFNRI